MEITSLCKDCENKLCPSLRTRKGVVACSEYIAPQKPMTNEDRIHAMIDEEFYSFIFAVSLCNFRPWCDFHCMKDGDYGCTKCIEKWLKQPAEEATT